MKRLVLVRREQPLRGGQPLSFLIGLLVALLAGILLLVASGHNPIEIYERLFNSSVGSSNAWAKTLNRAVPLGLAGLAVAVAGSMGLWNIGAEGQILAGAMMAAWMAQIFDTLSSPILIPIMLIASILGGALLASGPGIARAQIGVNEIITTLMLNEVALRLLQRLIHGPWKDPESRGFPLAPLLADEARLPKLFGRAHWGVIIAFLVIALFGFVVSRTAWGYELKVAGSSGATARYAGISLNKKIITVMVLSGGIAGLAGGIELSGTSDRIVEGVSGGYGFAGIILSLIHI